MAQSSSASKFAQEVSFDQLASFSDRERDAVGRGGGERSQWTQQNPRAADGERVGDSGGGPDCGRGVGRRSAPDSGGRSDASATSSTRTPSMKRIRGVARAAHLGSPAASEGLPPQVSAPDDDEGDTPIDNTRAISPSMPGPSPSTPRPSPTKLGSGAFNWGGQWARPGSTATLSMAVSAPSSSTGSSGGEAERPPLCSPASAGG